MNKEQEKFVRNLIRDMLMYILKEIPNNDDEIKNTRAREEFTSLFTSLPYKAPEILLGYYDKIRKILTTTIPIDPDYPKNPQWKKICGETNDQYVVFADIINKITRSGGKVCTFTLTKY